MENVTLFIENGTNTVCSLDIPKGAMLLANNNEKLYYNQVVAEIKKDANLILEEDRREIYTEVSGEIFFQNLKIEESIDAQGAKKKRVELGLIWVLSGERYVIQNSSRLDIKVGQRFTPNETIASQKIVNNYPGIVNFDNWETNKEINVINSSMTIENGNVFTTPDNYDILELKGKVALNNFN